jgi:histidinol-phosphate phosphatase family protein
VRAAFLDRDGTINVRPSPHEYVRSVDEFIWLPGAMAGLARLAERGYALVVASNQRGVARGLVTESALEEIEQRIQAGLASLGTRVVAFRYCTHDLAERCSCRKPLPGLLLAAARELDIDLARSWMIGDAETDVLAGIAAGCMTARIAPGCEPSVASVVAPTLLDVAYAIDEVQREAEDS